MNENPTSVLRIIPGGKMETDRLRREEIENAFAPLIQKLREVDEILSTAESETVAPEDIGSGTAEIPLKAAPRLVTDDFDPKQTETIETVRTPEWAYAAGLSATKSHLRNCFAVAQTLREVALRSAEGIAPEARAAFMEDLYRASDALFSEIGGAAVWLKATKIRKITPREDTRTLRLVEGESTAPEESTVEDIAKICDTRLTDVDTDRKTLAWAALKNAGIGGEEWIAFLSAHK